MKGITIGYHASHEQFDPGKLLDFVQLAETAGFKGILCSDHFNPWSEEQGESGFAWSWLGAAMQATRLRHGIVTTPGGRYHPAVLAQAAATLCQMFPLRFWMAIGSGQYLNEHITGQQWLSEEDRNRRMKESADIMRNLWRGETVTHHGMVDVYDTKLYTLPKYIPELLGAALTESNAECVGSWADGLTTTSGSPKQLRKIIDAFRKGGGEGKSVYLKVQLSYDKTYNKALAGAHQQWKNNVFSPSLLADIRNPKALDAAGCAVKPEDILSAVRISDSLDQHAEWLAQDIDAGVSHLYLHNVNQEQQQFIEDFGKKVLPDFHSSWIEE